MHMFRMEIHTRVVSSNAKIKFWKLTCLTIIHKLNAYTAYSFDIDVNPFFPRKLILRHHRDIHTARGNKKERHTCDIKLAKIKDIKCMKKINFANWKTKLMKSYLKNACHMHDIYIKITVVALFHVNFSTIAKYRSS